MKYTVRMEYNTHYECVVEASSPEEAYRKGEELFSDASDEEVKDQLFHNREYVAQVVTPSDI